MIRHSVFITRSGARKVQAAFRIVDGLYHGILVLNAHHVILGVVGALARFGFAEEGGTGFGFKAGIEQYRCACFEGDIAAIVDSASGGDGATGGKIAC